MVHLAEASNLTPHPRRAHPARKRAPDAMLTSQLNITTRGSLRVQHPGTHTPSVPRLEPTVSKPTQVRSVGPLFFTVIRLPPSISLTLKIYLRSRLGTSEISNILENAFSLL